jgi:predicted anti-sigma-YlaC factor YlaD
MLSCQEVLDNLSCYVDGEGTAELRRAIEEHLARCERCWVLVDSTEKTLRVVTDAEPFPVPLAVSSRLYARLLQLFAGR